MALFPQVDMQKATADAEKAMYTPLGLASPLWALYAGAAASGVMFWWMSQLAKPVNLEAMSDLMSRYSLVPTPEMAPASLPVLAAEVVAPATAEVEQAAAPEPEPPPLAAVAPEVEAANAIAEAAPRAMEAASDDLTRLVGIGPTLAAKLYDLGVKTYADIASWSQDDIQQYDKTLNLLDRAARDNWIGQARQLAEATAH